MKISEYFDIQERDVQQIRERIPRPQVFDFNYVPDEPVMREEAKAVIDAALRYASTDVANNLFLYGSRGSGKTLMVRHIGQLIRTRGGVEVLYANCRHHNTSFKILSEVLGLRPRGRSLDELWSMFTRRHPGRAILILDEADLISDKDRRKDILYLLSRSERAYMTMLLSNEPRFLNAVDQSIRSTLQPEQVHFKNYDALQIRAILDERCRLGGIHIESALTARIAGLTVRTANSDVRIAIKALYYAVLEGAQDVEQQFDRARRDLITDVLGDLSMHNLMILRATTETPDTLVKSAYRRYRVLCAELQEEPYSYVHFYTSLSYLQSVGTIALISTKVGRTYANRIQLLFAPEVLRQVWAVRWGA